MTVPPVDGETLPLPVSELLPGEGEGTRLLAFGAAWCGPWRLLQPALGRIEEGGATVIRIDVDVHGDLADRWAVVSLPTFVVVVDGKEQRRYVGAVSESELDAGVSFVKSPRTGGGMRRRR